MSYFARLRKSRNLSERTLAEITGLARETIRSCEQKTEQAKIENLRKIGDALDCELLLLMTPRGELLSDFSTVAISLAVSRDGFDSWKIHFFDFVDYFRKTKDPRLIVLPPVSSLDQKLQALLAAIVVTLCQEIDLGVPAWAQKEFFLSKPWFVAGMESLKASSLLESPAPFRRNHIFVQENFLQRA